MHAQNFKITNIRLLLLKTYRIVTTLLLYDFIPYLPEFKHCFFKQIIQF